MAAAACIAAAAGVHADGEQVTIAVLAPDGADEAMQEWSTVHAHLRRALPSAAIQWRYHDLAGLRAAVEKREADFVITNSGHYVELEARYGAHRIATLRRPEAASPNAAIASAIVVRQERHDLARFADLRGQRVAAVAPDAFGGYQVAWHALRAAGVEPARDFAALEFGGFPQQKLLRRVAAGEVDAAIVRMCLLESMQERGELRAGELRVLGRLEGPGCARSTRLYPDWPFAALAHTPHALSQRVAIALLSMPSNPAEPAWTVPTDYQPVHDMFRDLRIGPYAPRDDEGVGALLQRYRGVLWAAAVLLAAILVHAVRVEYLVRRRTGELRSALEARVRAERAAREQQEKLDHLGRLGILGELSSMLAHELNQPLTAIGNYARGMERRLEAGRGEPQALLEGSRAIAEQADRAREIMQRVRAFAAKRVSQRAPVALAEAAQGAAALLAGTGLRAPAIRIDVPPEARVLGDRLQIEEVLLNLMKNAADAMEAVPAAERHIEVSCRQADGEERLCVRDHGPGLDALSRERLFEPFFTTKPDGLGLGLAICKTIAEAHGGRLTLEPAPSGRGMVACLALPAMRAAEPALG